MSKYKFTGETKMIMGRRLQQIRALIDICGMSAGDVGGWIEGESNLSQFGNCWVVGSAQVFGNARVYGDAWVCENAQVCGDAQVCGNAHVFGSAQVCGNAQVSGNAEVCENARVFGNTRVYENAWVFGDARVCGDAWVFGDAHVFGNTRVYENAQVYGDAQVCGNAQICGNAQVLKTTDYLTVGPIGSRDGTTTFYKTKINGISVTCGCFSGTISNFEKAVNKTHGNNKHGIIYRAAIVLAKAQIKEGRK